MDINFFGIVLGILVGGKVIGGDSGRELYVCFEDIGFGGYDDL